MAGVSSEEQWSVWWIKFQIDINHDLAWHVVQEIGHVLNYLSLDERLPARFIPVSPPPYMNGGPEDYLSWVIETDSSEFTPDTCLELLEGRLPRPVHDLELWGNDYLDGHCIVGWSYLPKNMLLMSKMSEIKFIYFDVGGVVIRDFSGTNKWQEMLDDLKISEENRERFGGLYSEFEIKICNGLPIEEFLLTATEEFGQIFPEGYSILDDFVNRFERNEGIWKIILQLESRYPLGLLTNMYPGMLDLIKEKELMPSVKWEVVVDSSLEGVSKPDDRIFKIAADRAGFSGKEILFIENTQKHVDAAKNQGWQTVLYDPKHIEESNTILSDLFSL